MLNISISLAGPKHLINLAWPLISPSYVILNYITSLIKATGKVHKAFASDGRGELESLVENANVLPPRFSSSPPHPLFLYFRVNGHSEVTLPYHPVDGTSTEAQGVDM